MGFFDSLVLPQSAEHITLLHYMTKLILFVFLPFLSVLIGGATISVFYKNKGLKENNSIFLRFAKEIIELITINKTAGLLMGLLPMLALIFIYSQLLHLAKVASVTYLIFSLVTITIGVILIFTYRYSLSVKKIIDSSSNPNDEAKDLSENLSTLNNKSGTWGLIMLYVASYFFIAGTTYAIYPESWDASFSVFNLFLSLPIFTKWIYFIVASHAIAGALILFTYFYWEGGRQELSDDFATLVKNSTLKITLTFALAQPILLLINVVLLPSTALSVGVFGFVVIALFILFLVFHFLYDMIKNSHVRFSGWVFILLIFVSVSLIISEQLSLSNSTRKHSAILAADYEVKKKELLGDKGIAAISGAEIYQARCASCHAFDKRLVGPPYKETLPKYQGNIEKLIQFIRNPTKIDPAYPPMPNPGLKPNEARAVAEYIFEKYKVQ